MKVSRRALAMGGLSALVGTTLSSTAYSEALSPAEARQIAEDAYIYGYSLITTELDFAPFKQRSRRASSSG